MKKWYGVVSSFYDDGRVIANVLLSKEAETKPEQEYHCGRRCDSYTDWFASMPEAQAYAAQSRKA